MELVLSGKRCANKTCDGLDEMKEFLGAFLTNPKTKIVREDYRELALYGNSRSRSYRFNRPTIKLNLTHLRIRKWHVHVKSLSYR